MESLWDAGASVRAYDPEAMEEARGLYPDQGLLTLCDTAEEALQGADTLAIMTEWQEFRSPDFNLIRQSIKEPVVFDGRNLYDPATLESQGLAYYGIGRGRSVSNAG